MKIFLSVGHSLLKNGNYTSADGRAAGGCLEYEYCKQLAPYVKKYLEQAGHTVTLVICPEKQFSKSTEEKTYKLNIENKGGFDLACELHLNAFDGSAHGYEVYYKTVSGKTYADRVNEKLAQYFDNRGAQQRTNLYILNGTKAPAILVECFYCDSKEDYQKAVSVGMDAMGKAIAEGIADKTLNGVQQSQTVQKAPANTIVKNGQIHANNFCNAGIATDGIRGANTKKAGIKVLQQALDQDYKAGLAVDGIWGSKSEAALGKHTVRKGETQYMVTALEILLMLKGYNPNGVENPGVFGSDLETAVKQYQKDQELTVDGIAGPATFKSLIS